MRKKGLAKEALQVVLFPFILPFACVGVTFYCGFIMLRSHITGVPFYGGTVDIEPGENGTSGKH